MNMRTRYLDKEIAEKTQYFYIGAAGFVIKMILEPAEQICFKRSVIEGILKTWGKGGFLRRASAKVDFEIRFTHTSNQMGILERNDGKDHYYLALQRDFVSRKATAFYFTSLPALQILLKEILSFLVKKDGFLLHASGCQDKKGSLKLFLALSGGGKTTTANTLSKSNICTKFCDDMIVVRKREEKWFFYAPPFIEKDALPIKKRAKAAEMYFVKKRKSASKELLLAKDNVLREVLRQIWTDSGKLEKQTLANAMSFVAENKFYLLKATLNVKTMQKLLYED